MICVTHFALKKLTAMQAMHVIFVQFSHGSGVFDSCNMLQNLILWATA